MHRRWTKSRASDCHWRGTKDEVHELWLRNAARCEVLRSVWNDVGGRAACGHGDGRDARQADYAATGCACGRSICCNNGPRCARPGRRRCHTAATSGGSKTGLVAALLAIVAVLGIGGFVAYRMMQPGEHDDGHGFVCGCDKGRGGCSQGLGYDSSDNSTSASSAGRCNDTSGDCRRRRDSELVGSDNRRARDGARYRARAEGIDQSRAAQGDQRCHRAGPATAGRKGASARHRGPQGCRRCASELPQRQSIGGSKCTRQWPAAAKRTSSVELGASNALASNTAKATGGRSLNVRACRAKPEGAERRAFFRAPARVALQAVIEFGQV